MKIIKIFLTLLTLAIVILIAIKLTSDDEIIIDDDEIIVFETNHNEYIQKKIDSKTSFEAL